MSGFHEIRFPVDIAIGSRGGPTRLTDVVTLASGRERRNARWSRSRRRYDAGYGVKTLDALHEAVAFFEERRGRLYGFRWKDRLDWKSAAPSHPVTPLDQALGTGDGVRDQFQLAKTYGQAHAPYRREITKPVAGTVRVAVAGAEQVEGLAFECDPVTGLLTFLPGWVPAARAAITAGFQFDVPVRFDTDALDIDLSAFAAGAIPSIPVIEILP